MKWSLWQCNWLIFCLMSKFNGLMTPVLLLWLKIPSVGGRVHWNDPHHPAHRRIGRIELSRSSVLHQFEQTLHRSAESRQFFPHAVEKVAGRVLNSWFCGKQPKVCHACGSPSPAPPSAAKRGFCCSQLLSVLKSRELISQCLNWLGCCRWFYWRFWSSKCQFEALKTKEYSICS